MPSFAFIPPALLAGASITGIIQQWKSISSSASSRISGSVSPPFGGFFEYDQKKERLEEVGRELEDPAVWSNQERAQELGRERARLTAAVEEIDRASKGIADASELLDIKRGEWPLEKVKSEAERLFQLAQEAYVRSSLPPEPDRERAERLCVEMISEYHAR